jgi:hypothetical protein
MSLSLLDSMTNLVMVGLNILITVRHVSVRVPWHDRAWDGHVCDDPLGNSSCLALKLIAENRDDSIEGSIGIPGTAGGTRFWVRLRLAAAGPQ